MTTIPPLHHVFKQNKQNKQNNPKKQEKEEKKQVDEIRCVLGTILSQIHGFHILTFSLPAIRSMIPNKMAQYPDHVFENACQQINDWKGKLCEIITMTRRRAIVLTKKQLKTYRKSAKSKK